MNRSLKHFRVSDRHLCSHIRFNDLPEVIFRDERSEARDEP